MHFGPSQKFKEIFQLGFLFEYMKILEAKRIKLEEKKAITTKN